MERTYTEAIEWLVEHMDDAGNAVVSTDAYDENLHDHLNNLESDTGEPHIVQRDDRGVYHITRIDSQGYLTDDVTLVYPADMYLAYASDLDTGPEAED